MSTDQNSKLSMHMISEMAELARTLGNAHRLLLFEHMLQGEKSVETLADLSGLSVANTSQHLQNLRRGGLVQTRREGKHIHYRLGAGPILELVSALRKFVEFSGAKTTTLSSDVARKQLGADSISRGELTQRLKEGSVQLVDVRSAKEFESGHIPGAVNIPFSDLESRLPEIRSDRETVVYCRGPFCVLSGNSLNFLRSKGFRSRRFEGGYREWCEQKTGSDGSKSRKG